MRDRLTVVVAAVFATGVLIAGAAMAIWKSPRDVRAEARQAAQDAAQAAGRYQVVNGTPGMTRNIMLLDTWTGVTWVICGQEGQPPSWCLMERPLTIAETLLRTQPTK
jgi:hypothetical protein